MLIVVFSFSKVPHSKTKFIGEGIVTFPNHITFNLESNVFAFVSNDEISINLVIQFKNACLVSSSKRFRQTLIAFSLSPKMLYNTDDMSQATGGDHFLNATIKEGLADNVCPINKVLTNARSSICRSKAIPSMIFCSAGVGYSCSRSQKRSRNASFNTLVPMATIVRTLTLGVSSGNHIESRFVE